jgi:hypothetical protein
VTDFADLLKQAKLPERTVPICLRGDLVAEHETIERQLEQAENRPASSLAGTGTGHLIEQQRALEDEMLAATHEFRLRALPRARWRELVNAYPPRENDDGELVGADVTAGVNMDTFPEPLVRASVVSPEMTGEQWTQLLDALTDRQFDMLVAAAWSLNQGRVDVPFSRAALRAQGTTSGE